MNIIDYESNLPHIISEVICIKCKKRWISARPTEVLLKDLQCPKCKKICLYLHRWLKVKQRQLLVYRINCIN